MIRVLDLFAGSGSVDKYTSTEAEFEVVSLDNKDNILGFHPTIVTDILTWDYSEYPPDYFDIIWASPPCEFYSIARTTPKIPREEVLPIADRLSGKALEIIEYFTSTTKKVAYIVENPKSSMIWKRPHMAEIATPRYTAHYCMYGYTCNKPTSFACNVPLVLKTCKKDCGHIMTVDEIAAMRAKRPWFGRRWKDTNKIHSGNLAAASIDYHTVSRVPEPLIRSIFEQVEAWLHQ